MIEDVIELIVTGEDDTWIYGKKYRNGTFCTEWVRLKDEAMSRIGRENTLRQLTTFQK